MITLIEFIKEADSYDIKYKIIPGKKGVIFLDERIIYINPQWNEDGLTLCHEIAHHYIQEEGWKFEELTSEEWIAESMGQNFYRREKDTIDKYVKNRLHRINLKGEYNINRTLQIRLLLHEQKELNSMHSEIKSLLGYIKRVNKFRN